MLTYPEARHMIGQCWLNHPGSCSEPSVNPRQSGLRHDGTFVVHAGLVGSEYEESAMGRLDQQTAYLNAFELAKARQDQLTTEIDSLDNRQLALLNVIAVLEERFAQRVAPHPTPQNAFVLESSQSAPPSDPHKRVPVIEPAIQPSVHQSGVENNIQRRIDLAIGR